MVLIGLSVNHKRASLNTLDTLTLRDPNEFYKILNILQGVRGSVILQTCNRVEFYLEVDDKTDPSEKLLWHWALETRFKLSEVNRIVEKRQGDALVSHLVRLGSGLESMLVGEPQILGQLKDALLKSQAQDTASSVLTELFERSIRAASKIRQETGIGRGTVSLGSAAVKIAEEELGPVADSNVLLIGTGQVGRLIMKALNARGAGKVTVAGRNRQRTVSFCKTYGGTPIGYDEVQSHLPSAELVIAATKATNPILTKEMFRSSFSNKRPPTQVVLDLSSPKNVASDVGLIPGVVMKSLESIRNIADETLSKRKEIVRHAEPLVKQKTEEVVKLIRRESAEPIVADIYHRADRVRVQEVEKALSRLKLGPDDREILENMSRSLVEKILNSPTVNLRKAAEKGDQELLTVAGNIFSEE
jgi:glutamyl-tRNA reductase